MKRIPWSVVLLFCLSLMLGGLFFVCAGWFGVNMYGRHPDMYAYINFGGMSVALAAMLIVMKWASAKPAP